MFPFQGSYLQHIMTQTGAKVRYRDLGFFTSDVTCAGLAGIIIAGAQ